MFSRVIGNKSGQNTIEYILLVTAVVLVGIAFINKNGLVAQRLNATLKMPAQALNQSGLTFHNNPE